MQRVWLLLQEHLLSTLDRKHSRSLPRHQRAPSDARDCHPACIHANINTHTHTHTLTLTLTRTRTNSLTLTHTNTHATNAQTKLQVHIASRNRTLDAWSLNTCLCTHDAHNFAQVRTVSTCMFTHTEHPHPTTHHYTEPCYQHRWRPAPPSHHSSCTKRAAPAWAPFPCP